MSTLPESTNIWTPETITNIAYRATMIVLGFALIWKKYRRPGRSFDEEQLVGIFHPATTSQLRPGSSSNVRNTQRSHKFAAIFQDFITTQLELIVLSTLGDTSGGDDNGPSISVELNSKGESTSKESPPTLTAASSAKQDSLDADRSDIGLRNRS